MTYHATVLLHEGVDAMKIQSAGVYVDATLGAGGHSQEILSRLVEEGRLLGFDQDSDAVANQPQDDRFELCFGNFRFLKQFLSAKGVSEVDGVIADLGVSGFQFDEAERGFSFRFDAKLDMRMSKTQPLDARAVVNESEYGELVRLFKLYGESSFAKPIAKRIILSRENAPIETTGELVEIISAVVPEHKRKGELAKIFQAIRIEVNDELGALRELLEQSADVIKSGGRLVILSYHSLEDRLVKHFIRAGNFEDRQEKDVFGNVQRPFDPEGKVITPTEQEIENNPRARSAKMRVAVKR